MKCILNAADGGRQELHINDGRSSSPSTIVLPLARPTPSFSLPRWSEFTDDAAFRVKTREYKFYSVMLPPSGIEYHYVEVVK